MWLFLFVTLGGCYHSQVHEVERLKGPRISFARMRQSSYYDHGCALHKSWFSMSFARRICKTLLLLFGLTLSFVSVAETVTFVSTNQFGQPLPDVVIEPFTDETISAADAEPAVMDQINKRFRPEQLLIQTDRQVDFPNSDNIRHHVYSFSKAKTFELKLYADKPESPVAFPKHGVVVLGCNIHDTMIAYIFVSRSESTAVTDKTGQATVSISDSDEFNIWHKHQAIGPEQLTTVSLGDLPQNEQGLYVLQIDIKEPEPTNSFEDTFSGVSQTDQTSK